MESDEKKARQEASDKFEEAIREYLTAVGYDEGVIVDWTLVTAQSAVDDKGPYTNQTYNSRSGQPEYRTLGLLESTVTRIKAKISGTLDVVHKMHR